eukprot:13634683-Alexandrium_andersonii.AAC.1
MVTLLRHDNQREVRHLMDTAGWVSAEVVPNTRSMAKFGLNENDLRVLIEIENDPKTRFLVAWGQGKLFAKAAQGHNKGVSDRINMAEALE